jgi:hypothetical protein
MIKTVGIAMCSAIAAAYPSFIDCNMMIKGDAPKFGGENIMTTTSLVMGAAPQDVEDLVTAPTTVAPGAVATISLSTARSYLHSTGGAVAGDGVTASVAPTDGSCTGAAGWRDSSGDYAWTAPATEGTFTFHAAGAEGFGQILKQTFTITVSNTPTTTTGAPGSTTGAPATTTGAPGSTTGAPATTTGAPGSTTGAPATTTGAPGNTTGAPGNTTGAPGTTASPSDTTEDPVSPASGLSSAMAFVSAVVAAAYAF